LSFQRVTGVERQPALACNGFVGTTIGTTRPVWLHAFVERQWLTSGAPSSPEASPARFVQAFYDWYVPIALRDNRNPPWYVALTHRATSLDFDLVRALEADSAAQANATEGVAVWTSIQEHLSGMLSKRLIDREIGDTSQPLLFCCSH
jgi:hypothetical protein